MTTDSEEKLELHIKKGKTLRHLLIFPRVLIRDERGNKLVEMRLMKKACSIALLPGIYYVELSLLGGIFGKKVESQLKVDIRDSGQQSVMVDIRNRNYLTTAVPVLSHMAPVFDFYMYFEGDGATESSHMSFTDFVHKSLSFAFGCMALILSVIMFLIFIDACGINTITTADDEQYINHFINANLYLKGTMAYSLATHEYLGAILARSILFILLLPTTIILMRLSRFFDKKSNRRHTEHPNPVIPKYYSLYLRSFDSDKCSGEELSSMLRPGQTEESLLVENVNKIAPVYAIGCPKDKYLPRGAHRLYVSDNEWKDKVRELANNAEIVILRLGETGGLWWEVEHCLLNIPLKKMLFIIPSSETIDVVAKLYTHLMKHMLPDAPLNLNISRKSKTNIAGFIFFDDKGCPTFRKFNVNFLKSCFIPLDDVIEQCLFDFFSKFRPGIQKRNLNRRATVAWLATLLFISAYALGTYCTFWTFERYRFPKDLLVATNLLHPKLYQQISAYDEREKTYILSLCANEGAMLFNEEEAIELFCLNWKMMQAISPREAELLHEQLQEDSVRFYLDLLILAKKYLAPEAYSQYINSMVHGCILFVENEQEAHQAYTTAINTVDELKKRRHELTQERMATATSSADEKRNFLLDNYQAAAQLYAGNRDRIDFIKLMLFKPVN